MTDSSAPKCLIRAAEIRSAEASFSHPWNSKSLLMGTHLSRETGLERTGISLVRVPGGHESFIYHSHRREEEWVYILSGRGIAEIDGEQHEVGPGDFMGFPAPSVAHHLTNPFDEDLVYLMGGENRDCEVADFPRLGKRMVRVGADVTVYDLASGRPLGSLEET